MPGVYQNQHTSSFEGWSEMRNRMWGYRSFEELNTSDLDAFYEAIQLNYSYMSHKSDKAQWLEDCYLFAKLVYDNPLVSVYHLKFLLQLMFWVLRQDEAGHARGY